MAYTAPTTQTTGTLITAAIWNTDMVDNIAYLKAKQDDMSPIGALTMWPTDTAPDEWLLCDGSDVSQTTYADLFAVIGTTFGAPGGGNFTLPDLRGRVVIGQDDMGGTSANRVTDANADSIAGTGGSEDHTLTEAELPAHDHPISLRDGSGPTGSDVKISNASGGSGTGTTQNAGSGDAHNNLQPWIALNFIIYAGV